MIEVPSGRSCADRLCSLVGANGYQYGRTELQVRDALTLGDMRLRGIITRYLAKTAIGDLAGADADFENVAAWLGTYGKERAFAEFVNAIEFADRVVQDALRWSEDADHTTDEAAALTGRF